MAKVRMYSTQVCPYCQMAERLLRSKGVTEFEKILIDKDPVQRADDGKNRPPHRSANLHRRYPRRRL
jgi:glutaredoxin